MASFLKSLFGGGGDQAETAAGKSEEYQGYTITATPRREGSQWLTAGTIRKAGEDGGPEHSFIRADRHSSREEAESFSLSKGRQIIDEQGARLFS